MASNFQKSVRFLIIIKGHAYKIIIAASSNLSDLGCFCFYFWFRKISFRLFIKICAFIDNGEDRQQPTKKMGGKWTLFLQKKINNLMMMMMIFRASQSSHPSIKSHLWMPFKKGVLCVFMCV